MRFAQPDQIPVKREEIAILLLSAGMGVQVSVEASGPDEMEAINAVTRLINTGFGEN